MTSFLGTVSENDHYLYVMEGTVYHLFNTANGKAYVGQTWDSLDERWRQHCRADGDMLVQRAIRKHGSESFDRTVLVTCGTQAELDAAEDAFMLELGTLHPGGYNLRRGGSHGRHSDESRRKMSESHRGMKLSESAKKKLRLLTPWNKGVFFSEESKEKMRQMKLGVPRSDEACRAVSEGMKSKVAPQMMKPVVCLNDGREFSSAKEASSFYGFPKTAVARVARGERPSYKGLSFRWKGA